MSQQWIETRLPSGKKVMVEERVLNRHELRCLKKYGWQIVSHQPFELSHGDGESLATGQAAEAVIAQVTQGEPNYEDLIRYDGRVCNCDGAEELISKLMEENGDDVRTAEINARQQFNSGAVHDARGIYVCRACPECIDEKLSHYRPEIFTGYNQHDMDEPIEPEY